MAWLLTWASCWDDVIDCCMVPYDVGDHFWAKFSILSDETNQDYHIISILLQKTIDVTSQNKSTKNSTKLWYFKTNMLSHKCRVQERFTSINSSKVKFVMINWILRYNNAILVTSVKFGTLWDFWFQQTKPFIDFGVGLQLEYGRVQKNNAVFPQYHSMPEIPCVILYLTFLWNLTVPYPIFWG